MIPYGRQSISQEDLDAVMAAMQSPFLTQGPAVPRFESEMAKNCKADFGVATNSATSALHVAYLSLGLGPGDELWTSPITFVATSNAALYCGARIRFIDIDSRTGNLSVDALEKALVDRKRSNGLLPRIVVPVHFAGRSCDMAKIYALSREFGFRIVEDASHAVGSSYKDAPVGSCQYSDISVFSFHPVKILTTGEGGMALTNTSELAEKMTCLRSHGVVRGADKLQGTEAGLWYYEQQSLGFNYRLTDIQAALGLSQLKRLRVFVDRRNKIADRYREVLRDLPLTLPPETENGVSSCHLFPVRVSATIRRRIFNELRQKGILVQVHYIPVNHQPYYQTIGYDVGHCPEAESFYAEEISLPIFYDLTDEEQDQVVDGLKEVLS